jgi:signal peptidase II
MSARSRNRRQQTDPAGAARRLRVIVALLIVVTSIACDQATKSIAETRLHPGERLSFLQDTFRLAYAENTGAFLGLGAALPDVLKVAIMVLVAVFLVGVAVYIVRSHELGLFEASAMALFVSGGVGNLIDRVWLGFVRDFMNLGIGSLRTGIFNVADVALMVGAAMLLIEMLRGRRRGR